MGPMDFFERQDKARSKTTWLVLYFLLSVVCTIVLIYGALALIFHHEQVQEQQWEALWDLKLLGAVIGGTLFVILVGSLYKIAALSQGGGAVARSLGGHPLDGNTREPDERKLLNVVEEMAIASGTPVPEVYLLPEEDSINAFAAGTSTRDAAIGVTRGCMQLLKRDELQGVIAHEFSHILNGDMRLNLRLIGVVHGLLCLAIIGRILLQTSTRSRRRYYMLGARSGGKGGGNPLPLIGLVLLIVGGIGVFFGRLIKSAVSRQREYLADAAAVQFTRNPSGLANALRKIGGLVYGSQLQTPRAEEASHLFFGNGLKPSWFQGFATHPPLADRIKAIDPSWDGTFQEVQSGSPTAAYDDQAPPPILRDQPRMHAEPQRFASVELPPVLSRSTPASTVRAEDVLPHVGAPTARHLEYAVQLLAALPRPVSEATHDPAGAIALIYLMLLSADPAERQRQMQTVQQGLDPAVAREWSRLEPLATTLDAGHRLALAELSMPALRRLSPAQYVQFAETMRFIIESDRELELFEFALQKMVTRHLAQHFQPAKKQAVQFYSQSPLLPDGAVLLSALAHVGHDSDALAGQAFVRGAARWAGTSQNLSFLPLSECNLGVIDGALDRLGQAVPQIKKNLLNACVETVAADGVIESREAELLRAIADALDCPIPPLGI